MLTVVGENSILTKYIETRLFCKEVQCRFFHIPRVVHDKLVENRLPVSRTQALSFEASNSGYCFTLIPCGKVYCCSFP